MPEPHKVPHSMDVETSNDKTHCSKNCDRFVQVTCAFLECGSLGGVARKRDSRSLGGPPTRVTDETTKHVAALRESQLLHAVGSAS